MAARLRSTSASVVAHDETLMRIAVWPCQSVPPHQQVPSLWTRAITSRVRSALPKDTSTWFSTTSFSIRCPLCARPWANRSPSRSRRRPQPECPINMHPGTLVPGAPADPGDRIEGTGVHIAGLHAHDGALGDRRKLLEPHPSLGIAGHAHHPLAPKTSHRQGLLHTRVDLLAHHDGDRRCAEETLGLDIPAGALQQGVPRGRERTEVGGRGTGHETAGTLRGQMEEPLHPIERNLLEPGVDR